MTIKQLLAMPIGYKICGFSVFVKTYKKTWQSGKIWLSQVILMDKTGEMPADVNIGPKYNPLRGRTGGEIKVIVGEIQNAEYLGKDRKKLYIDQYSVPTMTIDEYEKSIDEEAIVYEEKWDKVNRGKCRHGLVCACIRAGFNIHEIRNEHKKVINELVDFIMEGE